MHILRNHFWGSQETPSPPRQQWSAFGLPPLPPPAADVICERPLIQLYVIQIQNCKQLNENANMCHSLMVGAIHSKSGFSHLHTVAVKFCHCNTGTFFQQLLQNKTMFPPLACMVRANIVNNIAAKLCSYL